MTTLQCLRKARALVRKGWTQGVIAVSANHRPVGACSVDACYWCAYGSIIAAAGPHWNAFEESRDALAVVIGKPMFQWNDHASRTKAQVLAAFDRAIERAGRK